MAVVWSCPGWLFRILRGSCRQQNAPSQQVEAGTAIELSVQQLDAVDLPFSLPAASGLGQSGANCRAIHFQPGGERRDGKGAARAGVGQLGIQLDGGNGRSAAVPATGDAAGA